MLNLLFNKSYKPKASFFPAAYDFTDCPYVTNKEITDQDLSE